MSRNLTQRLLPPVLLGHAETYLYDVIGSLTVPSSHRLDSNSRGPSAGGSQRLISWCGGLKKMQILFREVGCFRRRMGLRLESSSIAGRMEQRMEFVIYAVITLFYAVPYASAKYCNSRNGLPARELRGIIRRSQRRIPQFTLLFTLLSAKDRQVL